jgi:hypothetical protein
MHIEDAERGKGSQRKAKAWQNYYGQNDQRAVVTIATSLGLRFLSLSFRKNPFHHLAQGPKSSCSQFRKTMAKPFEQKDLYE